MSRGYGFVSLAVGNRQGQLVTLLPFPPSRGQIGKSSRRVKQVCGLAGRWKSSEAACQCSGEWFPFSLFAKSSG